jgi:hypothetical protein
MEPAAVIFDLNQIRPVSFKICRVSEKSSEIRKGGISGCKRIGEGSFDWGFRIGDLGFGIE